MGYGSTRGATLANGSGRSGAYCLYDGTQLVGEFDSAGHFTAAFGWGASGLMQRYLPSSSTYTFYAFDPQGSVVNRYRSQDPPGQFYDAPSYGDFGYCSRAEPRLKRTAIKINQAGVRCRVPLCL